MPATTFASLTGTQRNQAKELHSGLAEPLEPAAHGARNGLRVLLLHPAHHHAEVIRLNHHADAGFSRFCLSSSELVHVRNVGRVGCDCGKAGGNECKVDERPVLSVDVSQEPAIVVAIRYVFDKVD